MSRHRNDSVEQTNGLDADDFAALLRPDLIGGSSPKSTQVYVLIRKAIIQLVLPPGAVINEKTICEKLGISRTPLREAIRQLAAENLVHVIPDTATRIAQINLQDVFDGQLVRDALEMRVVRLAATRMSVEFEKRFNANLERQSTLAHARDFDGFYDLDEEFHRLISECGASVKVWKIICDAKAQLDRVRRLVFPLKNHLDIVLSEHLNILDGLRRRDEAFAADAMQAHLDRVFETIRVLIAEKREYFSSGSGEIVMRRAVRQTR